MGRSLVSMTVEIEDGLPVLVCLCDCATMTRLTLEVRSAEDMLRMPEFAYTCDGCQSAHWIKTVPA